MIFVYLQPFKTTTQVLKKTANYSKKTHVLYTFCTPVAYQLYPYKILCNILHFIDLQRFCKITFIIKLNLKRK